MTGELRQFRRRRLTPDEGKRAAEAILATPIEARLSEAGDLFLDDPETLLPLLDQLRARWETDPDRVYAEGVFLYDYLQKLKPQYPVDAFLLDEREYFLGETARVLGTVCRHLSRRDEARRWLTMAESWFLLTENAAASISKVHYQRLALKVEEREFEEVVQLLPRLVASFRRLGMQEDLLKSRFLEANILRETDRLAEAKQVFQEIVDEARTLKNDPVLGHAFVNLIQLCAMTGNADEAVAFSHEAMPLVRRLGNRVVIAKLQWGVGFLLRSQGKLAGAIEAYRSAQQEYTEMQMRADVAAVQLIIADIMLEGGQDRQAEWEIRQALPLIDEYKLVPEGFAALSLLRESLRRQKIDRSALRNLHGYFEEIGS